MLELGFSENLFKPWESVRELISCLERMNLEYLYYQKMLCFFKNMMRSDNIVITLVFGSFYSFSGVNKRCNLVCVSAYDSIVSYEIEIYCKQRVIELQCVVYTFFFSLLYLHLC